MRRVLVCTGDRVLAKRVRFLLARDDCEVEILDAPEQLDDVLDRREHDLVVLSRELHGEDAVDRIARRTDPDAGPPVVVLGGEPRGDVSAVDVVPDPSDAKAIVGAATRHLSQTGSLPPFDVPSEQTMRMDSSNHEDAGSPPLGAEPTEGAIDPAALARRFYTCASRGSSGRLELSTPDETLTFHLDDGRPVHLTSNVPGDRFGRWMVEGGRLSDSAYGNAAKHVVETGIGLGPSLVETGALTGEELAQHRADHARTLIVDHFGVDDGQFRFVEGAIGSERTFDLDVLPVVAEGFKRHASDDLVQSIIGERAKLYFKVRTDPEHLEETFHLDRNEVEFMRFGGRAYNPPDAAELSGLPFRDALKLLAFMWTCDEVEDFTPSVTDFEARIDEEKERARESRSIDIRPPVPSLEEDEPAPLAFEASMMEADEEVPAEAFAFESQDAERVEPIAPPAGFGTRPPPPPPPGGTPLPAEAMGSEPPPAPEGPPQPPPGIEVPPMPVPATGREGMVPDPMLWASPTPRGPDGSLVETPERARSREHFQRGVQMLGQGHFDAAEHAFREAIAMCSDEPVYLIGLARAIFYNPSYRADGKVPLLQSIVSRAESLAPGDPRVTTLRAWIDHAQPTPV